MDPTRSEDGTLSSEAELELLARVGTLINERYRVLRLIGHGSTGAVYACQHVGLDKLVALKVLHREMEQNASFVERFKLEAQAASRLEHPNSVRVLDFGQDLASGALFIAMAYIEGRDLLQVLEDDGPFSAERAVNVMSQILEVLGVAHALKIVHRDLKPENILVRTVEVDGVMQEHVTVCDFGIAQFGGRRAGAAGGADVSPDGEDGLVAGTPAYMSPEQARAEEQDARSDLYSAGVVLYQLLTLQLPFYADDAYSLALKHCVEVPPPPSRFGAVSPQLEEICLKALAKDPNQRFQTAREMRLALQRVLMATPETPIPLDLSGRPRRWGLPRQLPPLGTPSDAPAVELRSPPLPIAGTPKRQWGRGLFAAAGILAGFFVVSLLLSHNQEPRASGARGVAHDAQDGQGAQVKDLDTAPSPQALVDSSGSRVTHEAVASAAASLPRAESTSAVVNHSANSANSESAVGSVSASTLKATKTGGETGVATPAVGVARKSPGGGQDTRSAADAAEASRRNATTAARSARSTSPDEASQARRPRDTGAADAAPDPANPPSAASGHATTQPLVARRDKTAASANDSASSIDESAKPSPPAAGQEPERAAAPKLELGLLPDDGAEVESLAAATGKTAAKQVLVSRVTPAEEQAGEDSAPLAPRVAAPKASTASAAAVSAPGQPQPVVSITGIASHSGVSKQSVRSALNLQAITDCYRSAVSSGSVGAGQKMTGELELATSQSGSVTEANLNAPGLPATTRRCVEQIVRRGRVREADTGKAQATISLAFLPR